MLKQIGQRGDKAPSAVQNLLDCHERIRRFTALAVKLGEPAPVAEVAEAATAVHRYFTIALPLHSADEEESLAPRLVAAAPELGELLHNMTEQHVPIHQTVADLVPLWQRVIAEPERQPELMGRLRAPAAFLRELFEHHLQPEEEVIFPSLSARLSPQQQAEILQEMRGRRGG